MRAGVYGQIKKPRGRTRLQRAQTGPSVPSLNNTQGQYPAPSVQPENPVGNESHQLKSSSVSPGNVFTPTPTRPSKAASDAHRHKPASKLRRKRSHTPEYVPDLACSVEVVPGSVDRSSLWEHSSHDLHDTLFGSSCESTVEPPRKGPQRRTKSVCLVLSPGIPHTSRWGEFAGIGGSKGNPFAFLPEEGCDSCRDRYPMDGLMTISRKIRDKLM
jgi:hypothetical protein